MSEMIERIARSIEEKLAELTSGEFSLAYEHDGKVAACIVAAAALEAMREPTRAMIEAGASGSGEDSEDVATGAWESMIEAALKP